MPLYNVGEVNEKSDAKNKAKQMNELHKRASLQFKTKVTEELIPALNDFKPDLIIISAGFDGHLSDFYYFLDEVSKLNKRNIYSFLVNHFFSKSFPYKY